MASRAILSKFLRRAAISKPPTIPFGIVACTFSDNLFRNSCIVFVPGDLAASIVHGNKIGHYRVPKTLTFKTRLLKCKTFLVIISSICMRIKNHFYINSFQLSPVLKQRLGATQKWPMQNLMLFSWSLPHDFEPRLRQRHLKSRLLLDGLDATGKIKKWVLT